MNGVSNILRMSWSGVIEEELKDSFCDKPLRKSDQNITIEMSVSNILNIKNISEIDDIILLEYESRVCDSIENKEIKDPETIEKIDWILKVSKYFCKKLKLPINKYNKSRGLYRSSYRFCSYNYKCEYNYDIKRYKGCYAQHYVHNSVYTDLLSLRHELLKDGIDVEEIKKTLVTISFVINHMHDELQKVCKKNISPAHIARMPKKNYSKTSKPSRPSKSS